MPSRAASRTPQPLATPLAARAGHCDQETQPGPFHAVWGTPIQLLEEISKGSTPVLSPLSPLSLPDEQWAQSDSGRLCIPHTRYFSLGALICTRPTGRALKRGLIPALGIPADLPDTGRITHTQGLPVRKGLAWPGFMGMPSLPCRRPRGPQGPTPSPPRCAQQLKTHRNL